MSKEIFANRLKTAMERKGMKQEVLSMGPKRLVLTLAIRN